MGKQGTLYSSYENYAKTSATYDLMRKPVGADAIARMLRAGGVVLEQARLLDAGCGTGSYLLALCHEVGTLDGLEYEPGMLSRAREKLAHAANVTLHEGSILAMPFSDSCFDAVMLNQVIHHLAEQPAPGVPRWATLTRALGECRRVLGPGGALLIGTCSPEQVRDGSWYNALVPAAVARMEQRYVPLETLGSLLFDLGFELRESFIPVEPFGGERYFDPAGPFDESWRNGDSLWALATESELSAGLTRLRELHDAGKAAAYVQERERLRQAVGQAVFLQAWRR